MYQQMLEGAAVAEPDARERLVEAMATTVAAKGYPATTIADIVAEAKVSRRTFYEQFEDKHACMVACYSTLSDRLLAAVRIVDTDTSDTRELLRIGVDNLLGALAERPSLTYTQFVAIHAAGLTTSPERRAMQDSLADRICDLARRAARFDSSVQVPSPLMAAALVGGIGELIVRSVEQGRVDELGAIAPTVVELVAAVVLPRQPATVR